MHCRQVRDFGSNTGNPYRTFELYLERHLPAVGRTSAEPVTVVELEHLLAQHNT